jgi:hypothetical protein
VRWLATMIAFDNFIALLAGFPAQARDSWRLFHCGFAFELSTTQSAIGQERTLAPAAARGRSPSALRLSSGCALVQY